MPELPEVETIVTDLQKKILGKRVTSINVPLKKIVKNSQTVFKREMLNNSFQNVFRRGKYIFFALLNTDKYLSIHLRMTGQLIYLNQDEIIAGGHGQDDVGSLPGKYTHAILQFDDGSRLFYNDLRQFGYLQIIDSADLAVINQKLGYEPMKKEFSLVNFKKLVASSSKKNVKSFLLDQHKIAGIGNIYADEILFGAKVLPTRKVGDLSEVEVVSIYKAIKQILKDAIKFRGTTFNNYVDSSGNQGSFFDKLTVYQRESENCKRCRVGIIEKMKVTGRGTRYCNNCQK
jgi:formamidopyrimidine-DNA glycosylase